MKRALEALSAAEALLKRPMDLKAAEVLLEVVRPFRSVAQEWEQEFAHASSGLGAPSTSDRTLLTERRKRRRKQKTKLKKAKKIRAAAARRAEAELDLVCERLVSDVNALPAAARSFESSFGHPGDGMTLDGRYRQLLENLQRVEEHLRVSKERKSPMNHAKASMEMYERKDLAPLNFVLSSDSLCRALAAEKQEPRTKFNGRRRHVMLFNLAMALKALRWPRSAALALQQLVQYIEASNGYRAIEASTKLKDVQEELKEVQQLVEAGVGVSPFYRFEGRDNPAAGAGHEVLLGPKTDGGHE
jgi:hypothetical protein